RERLPRGRLADDRRRREIRLADRHVDDVASGGGELLRPRVERQGGRELERADASARAHPSIVRASGRRSREPAGEDWARAVVSTLPDPARRIGRDPPEPFRYRSCPHDLLRAAMPLRSRILRYLLIVLLVLFAAGRAAVSAL